MIHALLTSLLLAAPTAPTSPPLKVEWRRAHVGQAVTVTSPATNPHARRASEALQRVSDRLDALRTLVPHVVWRKISWTPRVIQVDAYADSGVMGSAAMLAVRDLLPGWGSAGSGVQQVRAMGPYTWRIRGLFSRPSKRRPRFKRRSR